MSNDRLEEEKKKLIEISIEEKMNYQEEINRLRLKGEKEDRYMGEMEMELSKSKEVILRLENTLKKMEIKFDEEMFDKKWSKNNF